MKLYNEQTGRFFAWFNSSQNAPVWTARGKPSQATILSQEDAEAVKRQLLLLDDSLSLKIVE